MKSRDVHTYIHTYTHTYMHKGRAAGDLFVSAWAEMCFQMIGDVTCHLRRKSGGVKNINTRREGVQCHGRDGHIMHELCETKGYYT